MKRFLLAVASLLVLLPACGGDGAPKSGSTATPTTSPTPAASSILVYATSLRCPSAVCVEAPWPADRKNDLWVYEIDTKTHHRLTTDGDERVEILPQMTPRNTVSFVEGSEEEKPGFALYELGFLAGETPRELLRVEGGKIFRYDWHPDGGSVAFLKFDEEGASALQVWTRSDGKIRTVKTFPRLDGRGVGQDDDVNVEWSPDGKSLLVVDTFRDPPLSVTMWVLDSQGNDLVPPRNATFGRWIDGATIVYRERTAAGNWYRLNMKDGAKTKLAIPNDGRFHPAVSPNGKLLALNGGGSDAKVFVFDLEKGTERAVGAGAVPIWISEEALAVSDVRPCEGDECGEAPPWVPLGTASKLTATGAKAEALFPGWTLNADVWLV